MAGPEATTERLVCDRALRQLGVPNVKLAPVGSTGWPDRMFLIPGGRPLFIEFKSKTGSVSPKQAHIIGVLRRLGYQCEVHDDPRQALDAILNAVVAARLSKEGP